MATPMTFPPIQDEDRPAVCTKQAAYYLGRSPQTLRIWSAKNGKGPIKPARLHGRLVWRLADIKNLLGV